MSVKKRLINAGILTAVFVVAVMMFSYITNRGNGSMTADMGAPTFPQVSFSCEDYGVNTIQGYANRMDVAAMRDTIVPIKNQRLNMNIKAYDNQISKASYTVYSLDGKEKLLERKLDKVSEGVDLDLSGEQVLAEERVLEIALHTGTDSVVYFYTRVIEGQNLYAAECMNYTAEFRKKVFVKTEGSGIGAVLEPNEKGNNATFQHVSINSDYDHVTWGGLAPVVEGVERISIKEINQSYTSVLYEYKVRCKGEENEEDLYKVTEFFRVRHVAEGQKTYLLDYNREMTQIFDPTKKVLNEKGIFLGIVPADTPYVINGDGSTVSFVQAGEVWNYNRNTDELSLVFSFSDAENADSRSQNSQHEMKLLAADKAGNTTFAVYGYMNRGEHEGQVGVAIYYYDINKNSVEEKAFISSNKSYGSAVHELGKLVYYSVERDMLYVMVDGTLYEINMKKNEREELVKELEDNQYVVSDDGHLAAYQTNGKLNEANQITIMNLKTGNSRFVDAAEGEGVRPLGFIKNDFVYGSAKREDTGKTVSGELAVPLYKVEIQNSKSKVIKTYQQPDIYVLDADFQEDLITLQRATKAGSSYTAIADDYITNNEEKAESNIMLESYVTELKETQIRLRYMEGITDKDPKVLKPKQVLLESSTKINFDKVDMSDKYYVYAYGKMHGIYNKASTAVQIANSIKGVVISSRQSYIWERGNRNLQHSIEGKDQELSQIQDKLKAGQPPLDIVNEMYEGRGLDLTGCNVAELLYIINQDMPIIAMLDTSRAFILTGYTDTYVNYIDVASGEAMIASHQEMDEMTQGSGNTYVGYAK